MGMRTIAVGATLMVGSLGYGAYNMLDRAHDERLTDAANAEHARQFLANESAIRLQIESKRQDLYERPTDLAETFGSSRMLIINHDDLNATLEDAENGAKVAIADAEHFSYISDILDGDEYPSLGIVINQDGESEALHATGNKYDATPAIGFAVLEFIGCAVIALDIATSIEKRHSILIQRLSELSQPHETARS